MVQHNYKKGHDSVSHTNFTIVTCAVANIIQKLSKNNFQLIFNLCSFLKEEKCSLKCISRVLLLYNKISVTRLKDNCQCRYQNENENRIQRNST